LLHGFTGSGESWAPLRSALSGQFSTVTVDLPGHGRSGSPVEPAPYALRSFASGLCKVLDQLGIGRVAVVGYSLGGRATLRFVLEHADRVAALVLESASPGIPDPAERAERVSSDAELANFIESEGVEAFVARWESL